MKRQTDKLLEELLGEAAPPEFRTALMAETLRQARRRKAFRRAGITAGSLAVTLALVFAFWRPHETTIAPREIRRPDLIVVSTQPLDPARVVRTQPGTIPIITSSESAVTVVETRVAERIYAELDDQQLLALLSGKPVALVRPGPNRAELIFLRPQDEEEILFR